MWRPNGISVCLSARDEEALISASALSFAHWADEVVIVQNRSADRTLEQARQVAELMPHKIRVLDRPDIADLWQNRQAAFQETNYRWVVRADSDYVCYTSGRFDAARLRDWLLSLPAWPPVQIMVGHDTVTGDFRHRSRARPDFAGSMMPRIYSCVPGMRFARLGRWEGIRYPRLLGRFVKRLEWHRPVWLHCDIKDDVSYLLRSERTNWRERGEFARWPTVESYVREVRLGGARGPLEGCAEAYFAEEIAPTLEPVAPGELAYPDLVEALMAQRAGYRIETEGTRLRRHYGGPPDVAALCRGVPAMAA